MKFKLWYEDKPLAIELEVEPQNNDVINHEGTEYKVVGRRFEEGKLHYAVSGPLKSIYDDPNYKTA